MATHCKNPLEFFLPGEFHGQRSLAGYSSWGRRETDMTEGLTHTVIFNTLFPNKVTFWLGLLQMTLERTQVNS